MQNPATEQFSRPELAAFLQYLHDDVLPRTVGSSFYPTFLATLQQLALLHPLDKEAIARISRRDVVHSPAFSGRTAKPVDPAQLYVHAPVVIQRDADCPSCPPKEVYLPITESASETFQLPAELLEPVTPAPPYRKPQEEMTFMDGDTVEEVLLAHGKGHFPDNIVKERLLLTLDITKDVDYDKRWKIEKLAEAILKHKTGNID